MAFNPYATPRYSGDPPPLSEVEQIRKDHIGHELSIKSLGGLYLIAAIITAAGVAFLGIMVLIGDGLRETMPMVMLAVGFALCIFGFSVGGGLRRLRPWTRTVATVLAAIGSLLFPVGTIINAYVLYLLLSTKGSMVFSERYQEIIVVTPHIRYKTSPVIYVLLGLMTFLIFLAGAVAMFS